MKNKNSNIEKNINHRIIFLIFGVIFLISVCANIWTIFFYKEPDEKSLNNKFSLLNPARNFFKQDDLIVNFQPLRNDLGIYENNPNVSIYFEYLNTGSNISINNNAEFWPASMLKVPVAMAVTKRVEEGKWRWDNKLVLMPSDKDDKFGTLYKEKTGTAFTIEELVRRSLIDSDNTANFILVRNLEISEINDVYDHIGLADFFSSTGEIGAKKYSVIFRSLYNAAYLSEENSQKLISYLSESEFRNYIQSSLPKNVSFSHKIGTGADKNVYLDSGIVYLKNRPYIITVMIKSEDEKSAIEIMGKISKRIYDYVSEYSETY